MPGFKKGDIAAIVETRVAQYAFGSCRPVEKQTTFRLVRVESASRDGATIKKYSTYPGSPVYPYENRYNRFKLMAIGGENQDKARKLYSAAEYFLDFDSQEAARNAILEA